MFDAKSLIEMMMKGAGGQPAPQAGGGLGGLADILGKLGGGGQAQAPAAQSSGSGMGGLGDLLGKLGGGGHGSQQPPAQAAGGGLEDLLRQLGVGGGGQAAGANVQANAGGQSGGGMGDLLKKLQEQLGGQGAGGQGGAQGGAQGGGLMDILGQVLGQAKSGVQDGARKVDDMTGASGRMREATGQSPDEMMAKLKELIGQHQMGAGAALGGLGAAVLGTKTGRGMAASVAKIGGLALIGGLAYKALQNYQSGKPLISGVTEIATAPQGSGFEPQAVTNDSATLYIRAMIAAAAADGRIDPTEHAKIIGGMKQAGAGDEAEQFLAQELNNPASIADLVAGVRSQEEAVQLFTAARIAVDVDNQQEHTFLVQLAQQLGLDGQLVGHIDAAARAQG